MVNQTDKGIVVPNAFVCGEKVVNITVEYTARPLPAVMMSNDHISKSDTTMLKAGGDWTDPLSLPWPCFIFTADHEKNIFKPRINDQISINVIADHNVTKANGTIAGVYGLWNKEKPIAAVEPLVAGYGTVNTYTFTITELIKLSRANHSYFTINKQNTMDVGSFGFAKLMMRFIYSPESYQVMRYIEKKPYRIFDLIGAIGGMLTPAIAFWIFLFGRGKYRSWGFMQRFIFRTTPNSQEKSSDFVNKELTTDETHNIDFTNEGLGGINLVEIIPQQDQRTSLFYFSPNGSTVNQPQTSNKFIESDIDKLVSARSNEQELKKVFGKIVDQRLWFLERTLSRHYLAGFRLRRYDEDLENGQEERSSYANNDAIDSP